MRFTRRQEAGAGGETSSTNPAGLAPPGSIQPFPGPFPFDEEPAIWPQVAP